MSVTFNKNGQWELKKSSSDELRDLLSPKIDIKTGILTPNTDHEGKRNYDAFKTLHEQFGTGHFSYHPGTGEIHAHSPQALEHVNAIRAKRTSIDTFNDTRAKRIDADVKSWTNRPPKSPI
jgi:hypothetical protein